MVKELLRASSARRLALSLSKWLRKISTADFIPVRAKSQKNAYRIRLLIREEPHVR